MLKSILVLLGVPMLALALSGKTLEGYALKQDAVTRVLQGPLVDLQEKKKDFLLAIKGSEAFYRFPKNSNQSDNRRYFQSLVKSKKPIKVLVNVNNQEIYSIEPAL